jgi:hypothetical protein
MIGFMYFQNTLETKSKNAYEDVVFFCVGVLATVGTFEHKNLLKYQNEPSAKSELILALEVINRPVDFCGTPQEQAVHNAKRITGLTRDEVIEMAANHARKHGNPVHAYQEEYLHELLSPPVR